MRWNMPKIKSKSSRNTFIHIKRAAAGKKIPNCGSSVNLVFITLFKSSAQISRIFNLQMLPHPLPLIQPHLISYHRDELAVRRLAAQVMDGIAKVAVEGIHVSPVPCNLDGVADGALHAAGGGTVFLGNLPNCCEVFSVLHRYRRKLFIVPLLYQMPGHISIDKSLKSDNSKKKSP